MIARLPVDEGNHSRSDAAIVGPTPVHPRPAAVHAGVFDGVQRAELRWPRRARRRRRPDVPDGTARPGIAPNSGLVAGLGQVWPARPGGRWALSVPCCIGTMKNGQGLEAFRRSARTTSPSSATRAAVEQRGDRLPAEPPRCRRHPRPARWKSRSRSWGRAGPGVRAAPVDPRLPPGLAWCRTNGQTVGEKRNSRSSACAQVGDGPEDLGG